MTGGIYFHILQIQDLRFDEFPTDTPTALDQPQNILKENAQLSKSTASMKSWEIK